MPFLETTVFALLIVITELLPIPAGVQLNIAQKMMPLQDQISSIFVFVELGGLIGIILYYLADLVKIFCFTCKSVIQRQLNPIGKIGCCLCLACLPSIILESFLNTGRYLSVFSPHLLAIFIVIGCLIIIFSLYVNRHLVWKSIRKIEGERKDSLRHLGFSQSILIGIFETCSFIPGVSLTGPVISGALLLGVRAEGAFRLSFLVVASIIFTKLIKNYEKIFVWQNSEDAYIYIFALICSIFFSIFIIKLINKSSKHKLFKFIIFYRLLLVIILLLPS
ncbi:MAG: undecaprenyl-diphosphate phosphatase [Aeromonadales bacterium]|nr:undecaprenyl-diphosphate phosphatase [Aeromonadales bacterium]MDY2891831.1 undecaprenyl-diphosphate phosphatase [Succinivibrio sp.]